MYSSTTTDEGGGDVLKVVRIQYLRTCGSPTGIRETLNNNVGLGQVFGSNSLEFQRRTTRVAYC